MFNFVQFPSSFNFRSYFRPGEGVGVEGFRVGLGVGVGSAAGDPGSQGQGPHLWSLA